MKWSIILVVILVFAIVGLAFVGSLNPRPVEAHHYTDCGSCHVNPNPTLSPGGTAEPYPTLAAPGLDERVFIPEVIVK